jgi:CTP synthase (UTP-ammonia lyase)
VTLAIGLIGDYDPGVTAHRAIPLALELAGRELTVAIEPVWLHTTTIAALGTGGLARFHGLWCVPASPYADTDAALEAIRFARSAPRPFLGSCGGFQHAVLEAARHLLGMPGAAHAELEPDAADPVITPLACALVDRAGTLALAPGSRLARAYGRVETVEEYHCSYGLAPGLERRLADAGFAVAARDPAGEVRALELAGHPFFVTTLFQSERQALRGTAPPIVRAFLEAASLMADEPVPGATA